LGLKPKEQMKKLKRLIRNLLKGGQSRLALA
jgi:hypothetical protein